MSAAWANFCVSLCQIGEGAIRHDAIAACDPKHAGRFASCTHAVFLLFSHADQGPSGVATGPPVLSGPADPSLGLW